MKKEFIKKSFRKESVLLIDNINDIIDDYTERGYSLTLRQLYYQLVAKAIIQNSEKSYKRIGSLVSNGRDAGLIDWNAIVDRTRKREGLPKWDSPESIIQSCADQYRIDKWSNQKYRPFVWVEKEALAGVISQACNDFDIEVDYLSCRGYMSSSTIWSEAQNIKSLIKAGQIPVIIHLGDHDPSGIDMTRDNIKRLELYSGYSVIKHLEVVGFLFDRIALNKDQIDEYNPPPNPTKLTDSRSSKYVDNYGYSSWELDALDPDVLVELIKDTVEVYKDEISWDEAVEKENYHIKQLNDIVVGW